MVEYANPYMGRYYDVGSPNIGFVIGKVIDYDTLTGSYSIKSKHFVTRLGAENMKYLKPVPYELAALYELLYG